MLATRLRDVGYHATEAEGMARELAEHYRDLVEDLQLAGYDSADAKRKASQELGSMDVFVGYAGECRRRDHWAYRFPALGRLMLPVAIAALPDTDQRAGASRTAVALLRWSAIASVSATITAAMLLAMQLAISLS